MMRKLRTIEINRLSVDEFKSGDEAKRIIEEALNDYKRTILPNLHK